MSLIYSSYLGAFLGITLFLLSINVIRFRRKHGLAFGDGGNEDLLRATRAHSNFCEYSPLFLILFLILELKTFNHYALLALEIFFIIARLLHAYSMLFFEPKYKSVKFRQVGMIMTFIALTTCGVCLLIK